MESKRDNNRIPTLLGVDNVLFQTPVTVAVDPTTHAMAVDATVTATIDPTGLATDAKQDTGNTSLAAISTAIGGSLTIDSYTPVAISAAANTANQSLVAAPGANKQIWVYGISYVVGTAAGSVSFQDEDDTAISGVMPHALNSGMALPPSGNFSMPIWKLATNKALEVDTVTCDIKGWLSYAIVSV